MSPAVMIRDELDLRRALVADSETEHLEFKEAKGHFHFETLVEYCVAIANEGGGSIVLGVTDKPPRRIVGTAAFAEPERTKTGLFERLHHRIDILEMPCAEGRVLVFQVPSRPRGRPLEYKGRYLMRAGDAVVGMSPDHMARVLAEGSVDFSMEIVPGAELVCLDTRAIERFRELWHRKSGSDAIRGWSSAELLENAELTIGGRPTYAALVLAGTHEALGRHLPNAELIFEYRQSEAAIPYQQRMAWRSGFLLWFDDVLKQIDARNDVQQYREGLLRYDIPTFAADTVREALLNAISHRDYRDGRSIFVRQYPRLLEIESPGGLPSGVTLDNILERQNPRNRRIAQTMEKVGFVERSGQGVDLMFQQSIRQAKPLPDYSGSDKSLVLLRLRGEVQDARFLRFLEKVGEERLATFATADFLVLDLLYRNMPIGERLRSRLPRLIDARVIERRGRQQLVLSRDLYAHIGEAGVYTRRRGLERRQEKELLAQHLRESGARGAPMSELLQVLEGRPRIHLRALLNELRSEGRIHVRGERRSARWFAGDAVKADTS